MASRYADYRTTIDNHSNSSGSIVLSDDDDDYVVLKRNRCKKNVIVDSDSESEKELENLPFHSTVIADHVLPNFEEMCVDNREERISDIAGQRSSLSTNSMSDHDVFQSSEESEQKSPVKPRKSTRISLALGKLLTIDSEAVSAACRKSLCNAKETFKNPSRDSVCDDEGEKCEKTVTLLSSDDSESEEGDIVKSGTDKNYFQDSHDNNFGCKKKNILVQKHDGTVAHFSSDDSVDETETTLKNGNGSEKNLQVSQEHENSKYKNKKILVQRHDGSVAHFSSDDSEDEMEASVKNGNVGEKNLQGFQEDESSKSKNKKILVQRHDGSVAHFSLDDSEDEMEASVKNGNVGEKNLQGFQEDESSKSKNKKILVQRHDGSVAHFSSDDSEDEMEASVKNGNVGEKNLQGFQEDESSKSKNKKILVQRHDGSVAHFSSDDSEDEMEASVKNGNVGEKNLQGFQEDESSKSKNKKILVQRHDGSVAHFSSDDSEDEMEASVKNGNVGENNLQGFQEDESSKSKNKKILVQRHDGSVAHFSSDDSEDEIESVEIEEDGSQNSGNNNKMNEENDRSDIQVLKIENRVDKSKVSDIRSFITVQKPQVTQSFSQLKGEIEVLTRDIAKLKNIVKNIDVSKLPDNGMKLQMKLQESVYLLKIKERELKKLPMDSASEKIPETTVKPATSRLPIGFGVKALQTQIREKTLTEEAISDLHGSISTCPTENVLADAPLALRSSVELMIHQRHALAWLQWRETQRPPAGILADDMGLGKTLTMISLVLKSKEKEEGDEKCEKSEYEDEEESDGYPLGGTLVVCPASLLMQWEDEIKKHCRRGVLEVEIHHGSKREENARQLARNDIVITTYSIVRTSANKGGKEETVKRTKRGVLHRVRWRRIILDEAHVVRNHKSQQSLAVCLLMGRKRWALTGTPIHNKELDLYALLKFLRCSPFDDYNVWRRWVDNKNSAGIKRLNTVINAIMLRRTKALLQDKGELGSLPEKNMQEIFIQLEKDEFEVYTKVLWFSKTLFAQFLQQRADKEMLGMPTFSQPQSKDPKELIASNPELANMFNKMQQMHDIKTHDILVLLLRLRQICVHPGLIKAMLDEEAKQSIDDVNEVDGDILSKMGAMSLDDHSPRNDEVLEEEVLKVNNPVFDLTRMSSKMKAVFKVLHEKVINTSDKGIIVSQWTSMLNIIYTHLVDSGVKCDMLSGAVPVKDRMEVVKNFNNERGNQVLLLSLTAGGVGLNLTGGNHLFLIDLHWNPQLESQAFDRIYRVGQKKPVYIYKFICQETIEERIKVLQDKKLSLAAGVLSGTMQRNVSKLTLEDLKSLFSM